jgi:hypothetical protein
MSVPRTYCRTIARAVHELDRCSLGGPETGADKRDWDEARRLFFQILDRNGFELTTNQIKRKKP